MSKFIHNTPHSEESRKKMSESAKRLHAEGKLKSFLGKPVVAIRDGKLVSVFPSASALAKAMGVNNKNICRVCCGERKSYRGFNLFYEEDFDKWSKLLTD